MLFFSCIVTKLLQNYVELLLNDFKDLHGACLDTDAASNALGCGAAFLQDHDLGGANLDALAAGNALLLVDHVNTGLGILSDCLVFTNLHALAALDADARLCLIALGQNADAGQILVKFLIECLGASLNALQTGHAGLIFLNGELLHDRNLLLFYYRNYYIDKCAQFQYKFSDFVNFLVSFS